MQVSATRSPKSVAEVPAAVTVLAADALSRDGMRMALPDVLSAVPGVLARDRRNYAQDVQLSIRGFGARSTFGIRGIRIYVDDIPATMPDGQGQVSNIDLAAAGRIEILRGPFSALYGNAAGGVIQVFSASGADHPGARISAAMASQGVDRESVGIRGVANHLDYNVDATRFSSAGFREHSAATRDLFNARLKLDASAGNSASLALNAISSPEALDPLGLDAASLEQHPRRAAAAALRFNTRKSLHQGSAGIELEHAFAGSQSMRVLGYAGQRRVTQFLAVPVSAQRNPLNGGGVVDLDSGYGGVDLRWHWSGQFTGRPLEVTVGGNVDRQSQHRTGFENFSGSLLGVRGALRRDQRDTVSDIDEYAQLDWSMQPRLKLLLGLRHGSVRFRSNDAFITPANPDDSGAAHFASTSPVAGLTFLPTTAWSIYGAYGHGFETPTFDELSYRPDGNAGLNFQLGASRTRSSELGVRAHLPRGGSLQVAAFRANTDDELAVATNAGGRSTYQNVGHARRQGAEASLDWRLGRRLVAQLSYTYLDARFLDAFATCATSPCGTPSVSVAAGSRIPGVARTQAFAALAWSADAGWDAQLQGQWVGGMPVNNVGDARAHGYAVFDLDLGYPWRNHLGAFRAFVRIGNAGNRSYAGSVIVNESNARYYEPATGRNVMLGLDWRP